MSFVFPSPFSIIHSSPYQNQFEIFNRNHFSIPSFTLLSHGKNPFRFTVPKKVLRTKPMSSLSSDYSDSESATLDFGDDELEEDCNGHLPWEGAIIYKRNSSVSHIEYCTTLERLGLSNVSSQISKLRASEMGIRVSKSVKDFPFGTPVQVSIDVTKKPERLRLDGIVKTVLSLPCVSCGELAAQSFFQNFSLLLCIEPIEEPEVITFKTFENNKSFTGIDDEDDEDSIDYDDRLYFPIEEKEIDISKNIRDLLHLEINMSWVCGPNCKGMCMKCGINFNTGTCKCSKQEEGLLHQRPLSDLKQKMQAS